MGAERPHIVCGAVLSTTLPMDQRLGAGTGTEVKKKSLELTGAVHRRREGRQRNGVKNLHG